MPNSRHVSLRALEPRSLSLPFSLSLSFLPSPSPSLSPDLVLGEPGGSYGLVARRKRRSRVHRLLARTGHPVCFPTFVFSTRVVVRVSSSVAGYHSPLSPAPPSLFPVSSASLTRATGSGGDTSIASEALALPKSISGTGAQPPRRRAANIPCVHGEIARHARHRPFVRASSLPLYRASPRHPATPREPLPATVKRSPSHPIPAWIE